MRELREQRSQSLFDEARAARTPPRVYLFRAAASHARAYAVKSQPEAVARELFGDDHVTLDVIRRAAASPATLTNTGWAGVLGEQAVSDTIAAATSLSAGAEIIGRGLKLNLTGIAQLTVPGRTVNSAQAGQWVREGSPIPVRSLNMTAGAVLQPRRLAVIVVFSNETAASSNVEGVSKVLVTEASALALDAAMFGSQADDGVKPIGLLNGVTPVTAATGGGQTAMASDIGSLIGALAANGAGLAPVFVAAAKQAAVMKTLVGPKFDYPILSSATVAAGTVIAVEVASFASGFSNTPEFETSKITALHMEDTSPQPLLGAPPVQSTFQTDSIALKMILRCSWGMRNAGHVAAVNNVSW